MNQRRLSFVRFLLTVLAGVCAATSCYVALFYYQLGALVPAEYWIRDVSTVKEHLAAQAAGNPRILITAGSGAFFGIDSRMIQRETGLRTINLATHGGLNFDYLARQLRRIAKPGDIILAPLEPAHFTRIMNTSEWFHNNVMAWGTWYFDALSPAEKLVFLFSASPDRVLGGVLTRLLEGRIPQQQKHMRSRNKQAILRFMKRIWAADSPPKGLDYGLYTLNRHGDIQSNFYSIGDFMVIFGSYLNGKTAVSREFVSKYKAFRREMARRAVRVVLLWPATMQDETFDLRRPADRASVDALAKNLASHGITIVGSARDVHFPRELFFDSNFHLNMKGKKIRTQKLLETISDILKEQAQGSNVPLEVRPQTGRVGQEKSP